MWTEQNNELVRHFEFANFIEAFAFLTKVAIVCEKNNHHAHITNVFNKVTLRLNSHSEGYIVTQKDRNLAANIDKLLN